MAEYLVFVYGSLRRGFHNHHFMGNAEFVCETRTRDPKWLLLQFNSKTKPGAFVPSAAPGDGHIAGEVYKVDDEGLAKLDKLEENGTRYQRREIVFEKGIIAWAYFHIDKSERPSSSRTQVEFDQSSRTYQWRSPVSKT